MSHPPVDVDHRFDYHPPTDPAVRAAHEKARAAAKELAKTWLELLPAGREQSLAVTALEESLFWANASIARHNA